MPHRCYRYVLKLTTGRMKRRQPTGDSRLRIVDLSVLPVAPRRGTAATAVAIGEAGAEFLGVQPADAAG